MIKADFMDKLLDGVEVEWKTLGVITNVLRGRRLTRDQLSDAEKFPVFHGGLDPLGYYGLSNRPAHTVMVINVGASAGTVGYSAVDFWSSDGCFCIQHSDLLNNKFLYYFLIGQQHLLRSRVRVAGIPTLDAIVVEKIKIPIPYPENPEKSLEIQAEIVRILDTFTELTAEITAELKARKKQYTYYRDKLLTFEDGEVEWKTLGEVSTLITKGTTPSSYEKSGVSFVKTEAFDGTRINKNKLSYISETIHENILKRSILQANDILFTIAGATIGKCVTVTEDILPANTNQALAIIRLTEKVNIGYIFYILQSSHMKDYIYRSVKGSAQPNLNLQQMNNYPIPVPPLPEQERIASILDKFDALTSSITEGLPREIELRQKQYEHYRNMLLSFPKKEA
jgi:type I restriction enzyme S subunit